MLDMELGTPDHQQNLRGKVSNVIVYVEASGNVLSDISSVITGLWLRGSTPT